MIFVYDIVLNWCRDNLYNFYEWRKSDNIEYIKRIITIKVSKKTMIDFLNYKIVLDKSILSKVHYLTEIYVENDIKKLPCSFIVTDGIEVLAIKANEKGAITYRSKLLLTEEDEVLCVSSRLKVMDIKYTIKEKRESTVRLTRKELKIKNFLFEEINRLKKIKDYDMIKYLYSEYSEKEISDSNNAYRLLIDSLNDINENHFVIYNILNMIKSKNI